MSRASVGISGCEVGRLLSPFDASPRNGLDVSNRGLAALKLLSRPFLRRAFGLSRAEARNLGVGPKV